MAIARTYAVALFGVEGHLVEVEADLANGVPGLVIVGLPDTALHESRDRVRAAIVNSGLPWPSGRRITLGLSPAMLPKSGSGFDVAMAVAITSVLTGIPIRKDLAMTGEITLRGRVLPIGGLKEKLLAALRSGIKTVLIPIENEKDLAEVPENVKAGLKIIPVSTVDEVLALALTGPLTPIEWSPDPAPAAVLPIEDDLDADNILTH